MIDVPETYVGERLDARIIAVRTRAEAERPARRARWNQSVKEASAAWREFSGYKRAPIIHPATVKREVHEMLRTVIDGRLMTLLAPLFVTVESIDRSLVILKILASPSNAGPERYAPKGSRTERISLRVGAACAGIL